MYIYITTTFVAGAPGPAQLADALATPGALQSVGIPEAFEAIEAQWWNWKKCDIVGL